MEVGGIIKVILIIIALLLFLSWINNPHELIKKPLQTTLDTGVDVSKGIYDSTRETVAIIKENQNRSDVSNIIPPSEDGGFYP